MRRVVLDTNILVSGAYDELSASWEIVAACLRRELTAVVSPALHAEYAHILHAAVKIRGYEERIRDFLAAAETVTLTEVPRVVPDDPEDDKVVATAVAGSAEAIVTNDRHLLELDPYAPEVVACPPIRILRPTTFEVLRADARGSGWRDLARLIGIGR